MYKYSSTSRILLLVSLVYVIRDMRDENDADLMCNVPVQISILVTKWMILQDQEENPLSKDRCRFYLYIEHELSVFGVIV